MAEHEKWTRLEIEEFQLDRINAIWSQATKSVHYYRNLQKVRNLPRKFDSLMNYRHSVPILRKSFVREHGKQLLSEIPAAGGWHHTSGSTGSPTAVFRENSSHREMLRARYRFNQMWDVDFLDRWAFVWGNSGALAYGWSGLKHKIKTPVEDWMRNRIRISPYDLRPRTLRKQLERIAKFKPVAIYSHSMAAHLLAVEAKKINFHCPSLKIAVLTAEPVRAATKQIVAEGLGVNALAEYGCVECGFIAGSDQTGKLKVREDYAFLETVPGKDGRFDIVVTVLNNPSFPLLRYAIGDVTDQQLEKPGQGFAALDEVEGRDFDFVMTQNGDVLHGQIFEDTIDRYKGVRRWRVVQEQDGSVTVMLEFLDPPKEAIVKELHQRFEILLNGYPVGLKIGEIPAGNSGKHRTVISELSQSLNLASGIMQNQEPC